VLELVYSFWGKVGLERLKGENWMRSGLDPGGGVECGEGKSRRC